MIIAIDPSIRSCGIAAAAEGGEILQYGVITQSSSSVEYHIRAVAMGREVLRWAGGWANGQMLTNIIIETPTHWHSNKSLKSESSEDIQKVYWLVGHLAALLSPIGRVHVIRPNDWKGSAPKEVMVRRSRRLLTEFKFPEASMPHDAHEAVCLAYWFAKRRLGLGDAAAISLRDSDSLSPSVRVALPED